jgi:hypothetical protein
MNVRSFSIARIYELRNLPPEFENSVVTFSSKVLGWNKQPSRFLGEMGIEL